MERLEIEIVSKLYTNQTQRYTNIRKALVCGYFMQVARREEGAYLTALQGQPGATKTQIFLFLLTCVQFRSGGITASFMRSRPTA